MEGRAGRTEPDASRFDCGLKLMQKTWLRWPLSVFRHRPVAASQMRTVLSSDAVAKYLTT